MTVCLDTNVFLQIFGRRQPYSPILRALLDGRITLVVSTEILLEYEEVTVGLSGSSRWRDVAALLDLLTRMHGNVRQVDPHFRLHVIAGDPDDNKFCDCAIAGEAEFVVTLDNHFAALDNAGYKPRPITPEEFIRRHLTS